MACQVTLFACFKKEKKEKWQKKPTKDLCPFFKKVDKESGPCSTKGDGLVVEALPRNLEAWVLIQVGIFFFIEAKFNPSHLEILMPSFLNPFSTE